eukprot:PITA_22012
MEVVLEDNGLKDFIDQEVPKLAAANAQELVEWKKYVARARRILLERKLALKEKLQKIKCEKGDMISKYLNKLATCRDELGSVGIMTVDDDMEEIRRSTRDGSSLKQDDEENITLASKARKVKGKASHSKSSSSHGGKKIEKSKVRCFHCHEVCHYATNCPEKKSKKGSSKGSYGCVWYLDSGASFHMTDDKNLFNTLEEKDLQMHIKMGDDGKYRVSSEGTIVFQREHGAPLTLTNVKYVPSLKKNLVSVTMLEDKGYDVVFSKGKAFLRHISTGQTKRIGIRVKNLYKPEVDDYAALSSKVELVQNQDVGELWHIRLGHLHHGALKIMQQISTGLPKGKLEQMDTCKGCTLGKYEKYSFQD